MRVVVADATGTGTEAARLLLSGVPSPVTLRELIRLRVREEVARYNASPMARSGRRVQPAAAEEALNGYGREPPHRVEWEREADAAVRAFGRNGFFVLAGDRQVSDLDEELYLSEGDVISFVRLVPLSGG